MLLSFLYLFLFQATITAIFDLEQLLEMTSIGTLMAYTLVCTCVVILRSASTSIRSNLFSTKNIPLQNRYRPSKLPGELDEELVDESLINSLFNPSARVCNTKTARLVNILTMISRKYFLRSCRCVRLLVEFESLQRLSCPDHHNMLDVDIRS
jgi:hypothetical protein